MSKKAQESMSTDLMMIGWQERIETAYRRMTTARIRHLPVHDESGEIVGMISDRDVQRAMISQIDGVEETIEFDPDARVTDYMSWPVKRVEQDTDLCRVAERMIEEKVSSMLICQGKRPVGIVTAEDLLKVLVELLADSKTPARWNLSELSSESHRIKARPECL